MFSKILLASDGSDCAMKAAQAAAEMAKRFQASLTVIYVYTIPVMPSPVIGMPGGGIDSTAFSRYADEVQNAVARRTGRVLEEAGVEYTIRHEVGHPAEVIVRVAEEEGHDLIVIGSRGLSEIKSFFMGSVSDRVCHHAHCPVLIVK
jgi:nucleotide-binding universal stress UspA family protein